MKECEHDIIEAYAGSLNCHIRVCRKCGKKFEKVPDCSCGRPYPSVEQLESMYKNLNEE